MYSGFDFENFDVRNQEMRTEGAVMRAVTSTLDFFFGCHHRHLSRVFTIDRQTYRVCCDCGAKFEYSLDSMRMEPRFRAFGAPQAIM